MMQGAEAENDRELLRRIARRNQAAFETLYRRFENRIFRYVAGFLRDRTVTEDVTCEVFFDVWRNAPTFRGESAVSTWIFSIARHKALSARRRNPPPHEAGAVIETLAAEAGDPEETAAARDLGAKVRQALERLSPEHREALELSLYHDLSYEEIAEIAGAPVNTVKTRAFYARGELRKILARMGIEHA
jgi:RNA polymerase sigma-70 factor (ECF subfamily)